MFNLLTRWRQRRCQRGKHAWKTLRVKELHPTNPNLDTHYAIHTCRYCAAHYRTTQQEEKTCDEVLYYFPYW